MTLVGDILDLVARGMEATAVLFEEGRKTAERFCSNMGVSGLAVLWNKCLE
jgi:hypothetical protein